MKRSLFLVLAFISVKELWAQNLEQPQDLNEVVIQENRLQIPLSESTRDIQVITAEEIKRMPVQSINELLTYVGGVDLRQRGPFGTQADISMDGGSFEQTLVLLDGIKLLDDQTAHNMMNIPVPLDAIGHIEVLRGPAARVYGINALTGAVNIVTKKKNKSFLDAHIYSGSSFKHKEEDDGTGLYGGGGIDLTGNYGDQQQSQLFSISQSWYNGQRYNTAQNNRRLFYKGAYRINSGNSVQLLASNVNSRFGANGFYAAPGDKNSEEIVNTSLFSLSSEHHFGRFKLQPRISDRYNEDDYRYFKDDLNTARSLHYSNALMLELNGSISTSIGAFGLGWESRLEKINSSNMGKHSRDNHGFYGEYKGWYWNKLRTNIGAYLNYNSDYGWQSYPGIDISYAVSQCLRLATSVGSGQRIPSFTDLYLNQLPGNIGNPEVLPEKAWQYEVNMKYHTKKLSFQTGVFYRSISEFIDWIRPNEDHPYSPLNYGNNRTTGVYGRLQQDFSTDKNHQWGYRVSYHYLKPQISAEQDIESKYLLESLKHQFIVGLHYQYRDLALQIENRLIKRELNKPYDVLDARVNYQLNSFTIYTSVSNILNSSYRETAAVPMPPRWVTLGVRYHLE